MRRTPFPAPNRATCTLVRMIQGSSSNSVREIDAGEPETSVSGVPHAFGGIGKNICNASSRLASDKMTTIKSPSSCEFQHCDDVVKQQIQLAHMIFFFFLSFFWTSFIVRVARCCFNSPFQKWKKNITGHMRPVV